MQKIGEYENQNTKLSYNALTLSTTVEETFEYLDSRMSQNALDLKFPLEMKPKPFGAIFKIILTIMIA